MNISNQIPLLKRGDSVVILAPAKAIEAALVHEAKRLWEQEEFKVTLGEHVFETSGYFAGSDQQRFEDFQSALNNPDLKAIVCARGGYGCIRMLDKLDWAIFEKFPKWIIGFSDITVFHLKLQQLGFPSIHGTMPLDYSNNSKEAISTMFESITYDSYKIICHTNQNNIHGIASGELTGGNLSIIYSLIGTGNLPEMEGKILFIEEISEQLYHVDRMFHALSQSGMLSKLNGLIVGGMSHMRDTATPTRFSVESIVLEHTKNLNIPICFGFPAGHVEDNRGLRFGQYCEFGVSKATVDLVFLK